MVGHQRLPWINNPTSGSVTSDEQEQEASSDRLSTRKTPICPHLCPVAGLSALCLLLLVSCVALSVLYDSESNSGSEWKTLLFDYQNISDRYLSLSTENSDLRGDIEVLKEHSARLQEQATLLNRTSATLTSANLALSLETAELMGQIVNLTSTNLQLTREHERLVQRSTDQEKEKLNMSETIKRLISSDAQREEEEQRLSQINILLRDELSQVRDENQELLEINGRNQGEIKNLSEQIGALLNDEEASRRNNQLQERLTELQRQNQNLSSMLVTQRQEAAEQEEAYRSLDAYCPVVNHRTKERMCRRCPDSWRLFGNKCYYISSRSLTWSSSRAWCQTQGGDLLIVDSEPEQGFVFEAGQAAQESSSRLWIGLTDAQEEGAWVWVDGRSVNSSHAQYWLSRAGAGTEPDDWKLDDPQGEDCGHIDASEDALKSWMDASCQRAYRWICEKSV